MRRDCLSVAFLLGLAVWLLPAAALANSSWVWISETRPYDLLPWVMAVTLLVETLMINYPARVRQLPRVLAVVVLGNALSFAAPYLISYASAADLGYTLQSTLEHTPIYIVGLFYLFATLAIELPVVYNALARRVTDPRRLLRIIIAANVLTTVFTAVVERTLCEGKW